MENSRILHEGALTMGIVLSDKQINKMLEFMEMLKSYNRKVNLTAITDDLEIIVKHFLDSLTCIKTGVIQNSLKLIDVGTGAGFPGIPLKIYDKSLKLVLVDASRKKISFLEKAIETLGLKDAVALHERAENLGQDKNFREKFDVAVSRAVSTMSIVSEYCLPLLKKDGYFICQKGKTMEEELKEGRKAIEVMGGEIVDIIDLSLPVLGDQRKLVLIKKVKTTPPKYPRRPGIPQKRPVK